MLNAGISTDDIERAKRLAAVRAQFEASGTVVTEWARQHGFTENMVHQVLAGRGKWKRGETHRIAVALGLKVAVAPPSAVEGTDQSRPVPAVDGLGALEPAR
ncbi:hypothetical protein [Sphingomonas sp. UYP23]